MEETAAEIDILHTILSPIVSSPDSLKIERMVDEKGVLLTILCDKGDMGKVIGKSGKTIDGIRTYMRVFGSQRNMHISLRVLEPDGSDKFVGTES